nr:hypothetical protein [Desulfobulbaceae bacterium]
MVRVVVLIGVVLQILTGCATVIERQSSAQVGVNKGAPVVYIHPEDATAYLQATVGVLPFLMPKGLSPEVGMGIGALYRDILLGKQIFPKVKFIRQDYGDYDEAVTVGREYGTDLVLAGKVNYLIEGAELGGSRMDISVRLINVTSGATVWHIGQTMDQPMDYPRTDILNSLLNSTFIEPIRRPMGAPVMVNMLAQSAVDVADVITGARYVKR